MKATVLCVLSLVSLLAIGASAQTFTTLVTFDGTNGANPFAALTQGMDGNLYGVTGLGGIFKPLCANSCGTFYKITPAGELTTFYEFCKRQGCPDGYNPYGALALAPNGNFYGTSSSGGKTSYGGTAFKITLEGSLTTLYNFCTQMSCFDGDFANSATVYAEDGNFYGTTQAGGDAGGNFGTAFKITPLGNFTNIFSFNGGSEGAEPTGLMQASDGNFYGTTIQGGSGRGCDGDQFLTCGVVYRLTPQGAMTVLFNFCSGGNCQDGAVPLGVLIQATDGNLYGTTSAGGLGGNGGSGTIFKITPNGTLTTVYNFCSLSNCSDGISPSALVQGSDGNLYGTSSFGGDAKCSCGTIFRLALDGKLTTLHVFQPSEGVDPSALSQATNGIFYGVAANGGNSSCNHGCGTIFSLDAGLQPFARFVRASGKVGQTAGILGQGFTGTTSVTLNGIAMKFTVLSDTFINATIPEDATTGRVSVTGPNGVLTSNVPFRIIH